MQENGEVTRLTLDWLEVFVDRRSLTHGQASLLQIVMREGRRQAAARSNGLPPAEFPIAVYAAAGGNGDVPLPIAAACLCLYLGADVLDNVVDAELSDLWTEVGPTPAILAAVTVGSPLALACLQDFEGPTDLRSTAHELMIDAMLEMSAGEIADVALAKRDDISLDECEAVVVAKSGAEWALFAQMGALVAGAPPATCEAYATFGRELGTSIQLTSDSADLVVGGDARDFASGTRTLPIVHALSVYSGAARTELLGHLNAAACDGERRQRARRMLLDSGSFRYGALVTEVHRQRSLAALRTANPAEPHACVLYDMLKDLAIGTHQSPDDTSLAFYRDE